MFCHTYILPIVMDEVQGLGETFTRTLKCFQLLKDKTCVDAACFSLCT